MISCSAPIALPEIQIYGKIDLIEGKSKSVRSCPNCRKSPPRIWGAFSMLPLRGHRGLGPLIRICVYTNAMLARTRQRAAVSLRALRALGPPFLVPPSFLLLFLPAFFRFHKVAFADRIGSGTKRKWGASPVAAPAWFGFLFLLSLPAPGAVSPCPFASASRDLAWHFCFCFFSWLLSLLRSASNFLILSQTPSTADPSQRPSFQFPIFLFFHMPQLEILNSFFWCSFFFSAGILLPAHPGLCM